MARQAGSVAGKGDSEAEMFELRAETAAYSGLLRESRSLSRQAVESATRAEESEIAASFEANATLREALFGRSVEISPHAEHGTKRPDGQRDAVCRGAELRSCR